MQELNAPEGKRFGVLFSYAKGSKTPIFSQEASFTIGKALAKIHTSTENYMLDRMNYNSKTLLTESLPITKQFFQRDSKEIKMTKAEKELLPYACLAIMTYYISIQCDRFDYWTNIFLNEHHLTRFVGNLKRWITFNNIEIGLKE